MIIKNEAIITEKKSELAKKLVDYRLGHNMSQEDLAKFIGASVFSISRWERKMHYPPETTLKLMKILGIL
jgi:DNA-binding transcriptional regulator YiaG